MYACWESGYPEVPADVGDAAAFDVLAGGEMGVDGVDDVAGGGDGVIFEPSVEGATVWAHPATASAMRTPEAQRLARAGMQQVCRIAARRGETGRGSEAVWGALLGLLQGPCIPRAKDAVCGR